MDAIEEQTRLINYIDSVIEQLNKIKEDPIKELQDERYTLANIAWSMEMYSIGGIRRRRRGKDSDDGE